MTTTCVCCFTRSLELSGCSSCASHDERHPDGTACGREALVVGCSVVGRDSALRDASCDERIELLADRRIHRRRLVGREQLLPDPVGLARHLWGAGLLPGLEIAPVAEHRLVEGGA